MKNNERIIIRSGKKEDAGNIAQFMSIASGGIIEFLLHDLVKNTSPIQILQKIIEEEKSEEYTFTNTIIAEHAGQAIGIALSYPLNMHKISEDSPIPKQRLDHLRAFFECNLPNSLYLNAIAVDPSYQGKQVGTKLYQATEEKAKKGNFSTISLHVWVDNQSAFNWYARLGFTKVKSVPIESDPLLSHKAGMLFMKKAL